MNQPTFHMNGSHADSGVDIVRIKLRRAECSVVVAEMRAADQALARWIARDAKQRKIDFEVIFADGSSLIGSYDGTSGKRAALSLSRFVHRVFKGLGQVPPICSHEVRFVEVGANRAVGDRAAQLRRHQRGISALLSA